MRNRGRDWWGILLLVIVLLLAILVLGVIEHQKATHPVKDLERWQRVLDALVERAEELGRSQEEIERLVKEYTERYPKPEEGR